MGAKGRAYDAFQGSARGASANAWCLEYTMARSARFDISLYGEAGSKACAEEWCRRMQYFYTMYLDAKDVGHVYSIEDKVSYVEHPDFTELASTFDGKRLARVCQLRGTYPR
jgi:hypothetical protein